MAISCFFLHYRRGVSVTNVNTDHHVVELGEKKGGFMFLDQTSGADLTPLVEIYD